jgi:hypothetical protein
MNKMSKVTDLIEYKNGVDYFVDKEECAIVGVKCEMCNIMIDDRDKNQFMKIQVDNFGFSVSHKEIVSLIVATGLYDEITDMIEQGLIK